MCIPGIKKCQCRLQPPPAMGYYFGANRAAWTFFVIVYTSVSAATAADHSLLTDLGLTVLPDKAKINISLQEYTSVMSTFLRSKDGSFEAVPELRIYRLADLRVTRFIRNQTLEVLHQKPDQATSLFLMICLINDKLHLITQGELNDLVCDLNLPKTKAELLGSRLQQWNLLGKGIKVSIYRKKQSTLTYFLAVEDNLPKEETVRRPLKMVFPIPTSSEEVESAALRLLLPPQHDDPQVIKVQVNQILGTRRRRFVQEETFYLSRNSTKWCDMDVTNAVSSWIGGQRNLGLELVCVGCRNNLNPRVAAITVLVHIPQRRKKRSLNKGRTDCSIRHQKGKGKRKCCRHEMKVTFTKLGFKEMGDILEPKMYEAGYCQGMCPPNYNLATNHSRIQGLMHQLDKREAKIFKNKTMVVPKTCCAPSKLGDLEILIVDSHEPDKLKVEKWQNMRVLECACS